MIRIDKFLANNGVGSRKDVKLMLKKGLISVNGITVKQEEFKIEETSDSISADGKKICDKPFVYIMLNKPQDYLSATFDKKDKVVLDLIKEYKHLDLFPVGRLDKDSEGLLLITNDGNLAHNLLNPKKSVPKVYYTETETPITQESIIKFKEGIAFKDYTSLPAELVILEDKKALVTIFEGKFHQVKNMFEKCGNKVVYLKRIAFKNLELDESLKLGEYRELTENELKTLQTIK